MKFKIGDKVRRLLVNVDGVCVHSDPLLFTSTKKKYGTVVGFNRGLLKDPWVVIEGEYYTHNGVEYPNHYNPKFLEKVDGIELEKSIKKFSFK